MMICPVCGKEGLDEFQETCCQCSTDLSVLLKIKDLPFYFYNKAVDYYESGELEEGMKNAHSAVSLNPDFPEAYLLLARIYLENEDFPAANKYLKKLKELVKRNADSELKKETAMIMKRVNLKTKERIFTYCFMVILAIAIFFPIKNIIKLNRGLVNVTATQEKILQELDLLNNTIEKERVKSVNIGDILPAHIKRAKERLIALDNRKKELQDRLSHYDRRDPKYQILTGKIKKLDRDIDYYSELIAPYESFFKKED